MRNRFLAAVGSAAAGLTLLFAPPTFAATEFGDPCASDFRHLVVEGIFRPPGTGNSLPALVPVPGVLTTIRVKVMAPAPTFPAPVVFKTLRRNPATGTALVTAEISGSVSGESSVFPTRVPVQAGDALGIFGTSQLGTPICLVQTEDPIGFYDPAVPVGASAPYAEVSAGFRVPVVGVIEPDADNDGFGDETQDKCPQGAAFQTACPVVTVSGLAVPGKGSVSVFVATNLDAPVTVAGTASLGKGRKATLSAAPQTLAAGQVTRFVLKFPKKLKARLGELAPKQKLTLKITASATNVAGQVSAGSLSAKLKGQARPAAKR